MCGIAALISKKNNKPQLEDISKITQLVAHRGPDGEGYFIGDNFALGHRRLSIIDLSESANQPMKYNDNQLIFNGEIFNYIEIRDELIDLGYFFETNSDTEVILKAYHHWGEDCVKYFNGMWALILFDATKNKLFCSRDRFGIKPFYYLNQANHFIVGSEIKQLLPYLDKVEANLNLVLDFLVLSFEDHTNQTFFKGIEKLPPSHNLIYNLDNHNFTLNRYYEHKVKEYPIKEENKIIEDVKNLVDKSVEIRLRSDVKVGTCLSGGLDSSIIATIASQKYDYNEQFYAIHAQSTEKEQDESNYAKKVARAANLDLVIIKPTKEDFDSSFRKIIEIQEEPFGGPSVIFQYFVFEQAKKDKCPVILDGQGGDELFLGYERYCFAYMKGLSFMKKIEFLIEVSKKSRHSFFKNLQFYFYFNYEFLRIPFYKVRFPYLKAGVTKKLNLRTTSIKFGKAQTIKELQISELFQMQLPHLLRYEDKNSMYHSIESRLPFLDFNLVEAVINMDDDKKINKGWSKFLLRKAHEDILSEDIIWRKDKKGFEAPENTWIGENRDSIIKVIKESPFLNQLIHSENIDSETNNRTLWRIFCLAVWADIYKIQNCNE